MCVIPVSATDSFQGSELSIDESSIACSGVAEPDGGSGGTVAPNDPPLLSMGVLSLLEDQESLLGASSQLQRALERMLVAIAESSDQVGSRDQLARSPGTPWPNLITALNCVVVLFIVFFYYNNVMAL